MALKIINSGLLTRTSLEVKPNGILFISAAGFASKRNFGFREVEAVLISSKHTLSFQVGREVFSVDTIPGKKTTSG